MPIKGIKGGVGTKALGYGLGAAEEASEPHFNQTTLLLHADGSEGEGNTSALGSPNYKAFRDNSTSAHALVVQGDAYGNDFSPYYYANGYWSVESATQGMFSFTQTADFSLDGDFTIEGWFYSRNKTADTQWQTIYFNGTSGSTQIAIESSNGHLILYHGSATVLTTTSAPSSNAWHHFAIVRSGSGSNNLSLYVDGTRVEQDTSTATFGASSGTGYIGSYSTSGGRWNGYLSNIRFVKGTAVYSGASHTVPTTPLTAITNTEFLVNQSNRFIDNSTNSTSLTIVGTPKISTNTPFTQSKTANVGSGYFDGTDDYVETLNTSSDFNLGTDQFTIEAWVYTQSTDQQTIVIPTGSTPFNIYLHYDAVHVYFDSGVKIDGDSGSVESYVQKHAWNHVVVQRDSGNYLTLYVNGVRKYYTVDTTDFTANNKIRIGEHSNNTNEFKGYIADVRFVKGSAVYSGATITVPTSSLTAVTNTKLLTCQYSGAVRNVGFLDDSKYNTRFVRAGDVSMGTFSPFSLEDGYWSSYHASNSGYYFPHSSDYNLGSGEFTLEFWMYANTITGTQYICGQVGSGGAGSDTAIQVSITGSSGQLELYMSHNAASVTTPTSSISANTWHFVSCVRQSNTLRVYIDGVQKQTTSYSGTVLDSAGGFGVGQTGEYVGNGFQGYISNLRFVVGSCLRDDGTTFTVPTTPLTSTGSETKILTAQSNRFVDNSPTGRTATASNTPKVTPFSPFAPSRSYSKDAVGGSAYFDGDGDSLTSDGDNNELHQFGTGDFTAECWYYCTKDSLTDQLILSVRESTGGADEWALEYFSTANQLEIHSGTTPGVLTATNVYPHQWVHVAFTRESGTSKLFVNGVLRDTDTGSLTFNAGHRFGIGNEINFTGPSPFLGYITNVRITKGTAVYTSAYTLPTAPLSEITNSTYLLNFANAGIIDHTMKNNLETEGNTKIRTDVKKFGTGSVYLDGSDELNINDTSSETFNFGTGLFTVEAFIRVESGSNASGQWFTNEGHGGWGAGGIAIYLQSAIIVWFNDYNASSSFMSYDGNYDDGVMRHFVIVRGTSGACAVFVNGTRVATGTHTTNVGRKGGMGIGNYKGSSRQLTGFIDEMRVTKGVARYDPSQSSVTIPTGSFANR